MGFTSQYRIASDTLAHASENQMEVIWAAFRKGQHDAVEAYAREEFCLNRGQAEALADIIADAFVSVGETAWLEEEGEPVQGNFYNDGPAFTDDAAWEARLGAQ